MMSEIAYAELHYTDFGDAETFYEFKERHGFEYSDTVSYELQEVSESTGWYIWCNGGVHLLTMCDPSSGRHMGESVGQKEEGYASYVCIEGEREQAEKVYCDLLDTVAGLKGEFVPLTSSEGEVIVDMESVLGTTRYNL